MVVRQVTWCKKQCELSQDLSDTDLYSSIPLKLATLALQQTHTIRPRLVLFVIVSQITGPPIVQHTQLPSVALQSLHAI